MSEAQIIGVGVVLVLIAVPWALGKRGRELAGRWLLGRPMTGRPYRTDATWLRRGVKLLHHAPVGKFWYRPAWQRAGIRHGVTFVVLALIVGWTTHPKATTITVSAVIVVGLALVIRSQIRIHRLRAHRAEIIMPLHSVLSSVLALPADLRPDAYINVPLNYKEDNAAPVVITLPARYSMTTAERTMLKEVVLPRLDLSASTADVNFEAKGIPRMVITMAPQPPKRVPWSTMLGEFAKNGPGEVVLGKDARGNVYRGNFNSDDPHWGASCGSRRGKSTMLQCTAAQLGVQDVNMTATFIDVKRTSFAALAGVPGFRIANNPRDLEGMWSAIHDFRLEMDRRMDVTDDDATAEFPMNVLFLDEVNQFSAMTKSHWRKIKEKGDPNIAPVWEDVAACVWQGAQFRCHLVVVGQRLDDAAFGGNGLRDSLGFRALAGFRPQQWMMLIGTTPVPRSRPERGRWIYSDGEENTWVQNVLASPEEIRNYLMAARRPSTAGGPVRPAAAEPGAPVTVTVGSGASGDRALEQGRQTVTGQTVTGSVTGSEPLAPAPEGEVKAPAIPELYTLAEAVRKGIVPMTADQLRQAKSRDGDLFPEGTMVGKREKWTADQLTDWVGDRLARAISRTQDDNDENE